MKRAKAVKRECAARPCFMKDCGVVSMEDLLC